MAGWKMPIGVQELSQMINDHYVYVDKTQYVWDLVDTGYVYFLTRPRRFGKSLLISTLDEYFSGNKELFKGLYIYDKEKEWKKYPVFRFDFSQGTYEDKDGLKNFLSYCLDDYENQYDCPLNNSDCAIRFSHLLKSVYNKTGMRCVVLVDEYDKSLLDSEGDKERNDWYRKIFKAFFGVLKGSSRYVKFAFFTGITKFRNVSIFSDLNNMNDISLDEHYSTICGVTFDELQKYFGDALDDMAAAQGLTKDECLAQLKDMYDGYHFAKDLTDVYNPYSVVNALYKKDPATYWIGQTTPSYLINKLRAGNYSLIDYNEGCRIDESTLGEIEQAQNNDPTALLYQSGYLTIKSYDKEFEEFTLTYPNKEIRTGFTKWLVPLYLTKMTNGMGATIRDIQRALVTADTDALFRCLTAIYGFLPYYEGKEDAHTVMERDMRNIASIIFVLLGAFTTCEAHFSSGRADCIVQNKNYVYIFEFKVDKSAKEALDQIEQRGYAKPFSGDSRRIIKIGIAFSSEKRNISDTAVDGA